MKKRLIPAAILTIILLIISYILYSKFYKEEFDFGKKGNTYEFTVTLLNKNKEFGTLYKFNKGESIEKYSGCLTNHLYKIEYFDKNGVFYTQMVDAFIPTERLMAWCGGRECYNPISTIKDFPDKGFSYKVRLTVIKPASLFEVISKDTKTYFKFQSAPPFSTSKINDLLNFTPPTDEEIKKEREKCFRVDVVLGEEENETLSSLREYIKQDNVKKVQEMIESGVSINTKMNHNNTPLMLASFYNSLNTMKYLLDNKADTEAKNVLDNRAILYAFGKKNTEAIKLLLQYNATLKESDNVYPFVEGYAGVRMFGEALPLAYYMIKPAYADGIEIYLKHGLDVNYIRCRILYDSTQSCYVLGDIVDYPKNHFSSKEKQEEIIKLIETYGGKTYQELTNNTTKQGE
ncbi:MAG: ankyrin repeat domain-containing protein [Campylobacteraceae bacterium]